MKNQSIKAWNNFLIFNNNKISSINNPPSHFNKDYCNINSLMDFLKFINKPEFKIIISKSKKLLLFYRETNHLKLNYYNLSPFLVMFLLNCIVFIVSKFSSLYISYTYCIWYHSALECLIYTLPICLLFVVPVLPVTCSDCLICTTTCYHSIICMIP